jgi:hypothetical protein
MEDISEYFNILDFRSFTPNAINAPHTNRFNYFPNFNWLWGPIWPSDILNSIGYISYFDFYVIGDDTTGGQNVIIYKDNGYVAPVRCSYFFTAGGKKFYLSYYHISILKPTVDIDLQCTVDTPEIMSNLVYLDKNSIKARNVWRN